MVNPRSRSWDPRRGQDEPTEPPARRLRIGYCVAFGLALMLAAVVAPSPGATAEDAPVGRTTTTAHDQVQLELTRLQWSWAEFKLGRVADPDDVAGERQRLRDRAALSEYLASPSDPLFRAAVLLAVQQGQVELVPQLRAALLDADESTAELLVAAIDQLEPWPDAELAELLASETRGVALAALRIAGAREQPPLDPIVDRLTDADGEIREAALAATPDLLPAEAGARILLALPSAPVDQIGEALMALTRCPGTAEIDDVLYRQLERELPHCDRVLDALARRATPLTRPELVHRLVKDTFAPLPTRCRALRCLEMTAARDASDMLEKERLHHPVLDYFAARALLAAGRASGVDLLLEVLRTSDDSYDEPEVRFVQEAKLGARQILAALADTSLYADPAEWATWASQRPELKVDRLPAPTVVFGG